MVISFLLSIIPNECAALKKQKPEAVASTYNPTIQKPEAGGSLIYNEFHASLSFIGQEVGVGMFVYFS